MYIKELLIITSMAFSQEIFSQEVDLYEVDKVQAQEAHQLFYSPKPENISFPSDDEGAQWFPEAGFGLFMHWGIHSVNGLDPSWAMVKNCPWHQKGQYDFYQDEGKVHYYDLAKKFNPQYYDPDKWFAAAKAAGFTYAVLTTKHHDGYALWPTKYGNMNTRVYMGGRDLIKEYVDACRKNGIKVGFYFSPRDWHYPGYPTAYVDLDHNVRREKPIIDDPEKNQALFEKFYAYTIGQLRELLTRYGKIDLLWFDGIGWTGVDDLRAEQTIAWIRELQPGIVINPRWSGIGDFKTTECKPGILPEDYHPGLWWEACNIWSAGSWGYSKSEKFRPLSWVFENLVHVRQYGGNFLCNVGPRPNGQMANLFYTYCRELEAWMGHSKESLIGAGASPGVEKSNVPITTRENIWYLHLLPSFEGKVELNIADKPDQIYILRTHEKLDIEKDGKGWQINFPKQYRTVTDDVIVVNW